MVETSKGRPHALPLSISHRELYYLALRSNKKPLVVSYHADIVGYNKALMFYRPFLFKFLERADRIIVASPDMRERSPFLTRFKNKCVVIPYGIQTEKFRLTEAVKSKSTIVLVAVQVWADAGHLPD